MNATIVIFFASLNFLPVHNHNWLNYSLPNAFPYFLDSYLIHLKQFNYNKRMTPITAQESINSTITAVFIGMMNTTKENNTITW